MKKTVAIETDYSKEWRKYMKILDYSTGVSALEAKGIKEPYSTNILRCAFDAGWNAVASIIGRNTPQE